MKNIIKSFCLVFMILGITSCGDDFLDINRDPLAATEAPANLLFPEVIVNMSSSRSIELNSVNIQTQHWASGGSAGVFNNPERYTISTFTTGNTWSNYYSVSLKNLFLARQDAENAENPANNVIAQARIMEAFLYLNLTLIWEKVPFTESLKAAEFPTPNFDDQEVILDGIVSLLNEAIGLIDESDPRKVDSGDLIFAGDLQAWTRFANSLKLRTLMYIANQNAGRVGGEIQALANDVTSLIAANSEEAQLSFNTSVGNENPIWKTLDNFAGGLNVFWHANSTCVDILNADNDPRISTYYDLPPDDTLGVYVGVDPGILAHENDVHSVVSLNIIRPDFPDRYATAAETHLLLAEAAAKGIISGGMSSADALYRDGVQLALDWFDGQAGAIDATAKADFMAALPDLSGMSEADALNEIHKQQYIEVFGRGTEAWGNWKRTKYPDLALPEQAQLSDIIRRYPYPPDELGANPNAAEQLSLDTPMWFEN